MEVSLYYGPNSVKLDIPQENIAKVLRPRQLEFQGTNTEFLSKAIGASRVQFIKQTQGSTVGLLVPDGTRDLPLVDILSLLLPMLGHSQKVLFFICTGSHSPDTEANNAIIDVIKSQAALAGIQSYQVIAHDCQTDALSNAGRTNNGTEVYYNSHLDEVDCFCVLSDVKHHYFAGYSNPVKNIVPGLCGFQTIEQNHSLTFDIRSGAGNHPWHPDPSRRDNPLATDLLEAMELVVGQRPVWAVVTISDAGAVQWADFGLANEVSARAFEKADKWNMRTVDKVDFMIVSPGGLPNDVDLYIAQRALELTNSVVDDGGQILFLAACPNGIGSDLTREHFEEKLKKPLPDILSCQRSDYHLFEHKPYRFAQLIQRLEKLWFHTKIPDNDVRKMHLVPSNSPQQVVSDWINHNLEARILVVDGANKLFLKSREG